MTYNGSEQHLENLKKAREKSNNIKFECGFCDKLFTKSNLIKHEDSCEKNPYIYKNCPVCSLPFKGKSVTCSHACSNTFFKKGKVELSSYRAICFRYHKKECVICGESNLLDIKIWLKIV